MNFLDDICVCLSLGVIGYKNKVSKIKNKIYKTVLYVG